MSFFFKLLSGLLQAIWKSIRIVDFELAGMGSDRVLRAPLYCIMVAFKLLAGKGVPTECY
jgi:hypothetical protein